MNIHELANILQTHIAVQPHISQNGCALISARLNDVETKSDPNDTVLTDTYGIGASTQEAVDDYISKIRGRYLVVRGYRSNRLEMKCPDDLVGTKF